MLLHMRLNIKQLFEDESNDEEKDKTEEVDDNNVNNDIILHIVY